MSKSYFKHNRHTHTARTHANGYNDLIPLGVYNSSGFNPKSLSVPLMTWFDGTQGLTSSSWTNSGTFGGSATLSGTIIVTVNGLTACNFKNGNSYGAFQWKFPVGGDSRAVFGVWKLPIQLTSGQSSYQIAEQNNSFYWACATIYGSSTTNLLFTVSYNQTFLIYSNPNTTITDTNYNTLALSFDASSPSSSNNYITLNGTAVGSSAGNDTGFYDSGNVTNAWLNGGGTSGGGAPVSSVGMVLCEILVYDGIVTPSDATKVTNYLRTKWGTA